MRRELVAAGSFLLAAAVCAPRAVHAQPAPPRPADAIGAAAPSKPVTPEAREEAAQRYTRGREFYAEENFSAALVEFRRAYDLTGEYRVLYNIGQVCFQVQDYVCAQDALTKYLDAGGAEVPDGRRNDVRADIEKLRGRIGTVEIDAGEADVAITIDDIPRGATPLEPLRLSAGHHRLMATKVGRVTHTRAFDLGGAETQRLQVRLVEVAPERLVVRERAGAPEPPKRWGTLSFVGLGVGGAFAVASAVTGVMALDASSELKDTRYYGDATGDVDARQRKVETLRTVSDVCAGIAIGTVAATLIWTLTRKVDAEPPKAAGRLTLGVAGSTAVVKGEF